MNLPVPPPLVVPGGRTAAVAAGQGPDAASGLVAASFTGTDLALLAVIVVLLAGTVLLSLAEAGLTRVNRTKAQSLANEGRRRADTLADLLGQPRSFLTPVRLATLICELGQAVLAGLVGWRLFGVAGVAVAMAIDVVVVFVAESAPRTWAVLNPEQAALATVRFVRLVVRVPPLSLVARALIWLTNLVVPGKGLEQGPYLSEDELLAVADLSVEEGVIEADERDLIESIIEFGDTRVREVMVPRPDMVTVDASFRVADVMEVVLLNGYSRLPVRGEGIDDVIGVVYAKDLMRAERDGMEDERVAQLLRPAHFVPETKRVPEMLKEMQRGRFHMAIVVDEYGGTAGLVTLEDLLEELVGEIADEFDVEDPLVEPLPGGSLRVHARTPLDEVNDLLHANLPEGDWDTIGGLLYRELGHVPVEGESVVVDGWRLAAQRVQGRRIGRVLISRNGPDRPDEPATAGDLGDVAPDAGRGRADGVDGVDGVVDGDEPGGVAPPAGGPAVDRTSARAHPQGRPPPPAVPPHDTGGATEQR